jgi:glycosyltransferase involved in cell wall biosynthesis
MRVVFVTTVFEGVDTGPGIFANYLWRAFRDDPDLEFHVVAPEFSASHPRLHAAGHGSGSLDLYRRVQDKALEVVGMCAGPTILHGNSTHGMSRLAGYGGPLIVQVNDYETATFPAAALALLREAGPRKVLSTAWRYRQESRVLRHASLALCNSEYTARIVSAHYRLNPDRVRVLHKAVDTSHFRRPDRLPPDPAPDRPAGGRMVFVGSDWKRKGLDVLIQATALLVSRYPALSLVVIGPDAYDRELLETVRQSGIEGCVKLVGRAPRDMLAQYLWHSDFFVLPSRREALGVAVLEGMAAGLPVIATAVGGIPEILRDGSEGRLVPADHVEALSGAIGEVLSDADRRLRMRSAAVLRAEEFSVRTMTARLKACYADVLQPAGRSADNSR